MRDTLEQQLKYAEAGEIPILDDDARVVGWQSPVRYFDISILKDLVKDAAPNPLWSPIYDESGSVMGWWLEG